MYIFGLEPFHPCALTISYFALISANRRRISVLLIFDSNASLLGPSSSSSSPRGDASRSVDLENFQLSPSFLSALVVDCLSAGARFLADDEGGYLLVGDGRAIGVGDSGVVNCGG